MKARYLTAAVLGLPLSVGQIGLVAPSNEAAVAWIDRWPDWPGSALVVHGPPGSGKTHLAEVWRARSGVGGQPAAQERSPA